MKKLFFVACLGVMFTSLVNPAEAQRRRRQDPCESGTGPMLVSIGMSIGEDVGVQLWEDLDQNCFELDEFIGIVADVSTPGAGNSCLGAGFIDGLNEVVEEVSDKCVDQCLDEGDALGELLGKTACGGLDLYRIPPPLCSRIARASCLRSFDDYVDANCPYEDEDLLSAYRSFCSDITPSILF